jgi:hypothetical protein
MRRDAKGVSSIGTMPIFTQMMINIIRFPSSIHSIELNIVDRILALVLESIDNISVAIAIVAAGRLSLY